MDKQIFTWGAVAAAFAGLFLWSYAQGLRLDAAEYREEVLKEINAENQRVMSQMTADHENTVAVLEELLLAESIRQARTEATMKGIDDAPKTDDAPVAPVLRRVLDGLHH